MIIVKTYDTAGTDWMVYHQSLGAGAHLELNLSNAKSDTSSTWGNTEPTANDFTVEKLTYTNGNGRNFVAYLFADNPDGGIKCGSYNGKETVDCGFKPGWLLLKRTQSTGDWYIIDKNRGVDGRRKSISANSNEPEQDAFDVTFTDTGFINNYYDWTRHLRRHCRLHRQVLRREHQLDRHEHTLTRRYGVDPLETDLRKQGIYPLTEQPDLWEVDAYVKEGDAYNPVRDYSSEINAANAKVEALLARVQALEAEEEEGNGGGY